MIPDYVWFVLVFAVTYCAAFAVWLAVGELISRRRRKGE